MLTSPTPLSPLRRQAATPTIAQSWARRLNFWKFQPGAVHLRNADLGQHLVGRQRGLQETLEEVACGNLAGAVGALGDIRRAERQRRRRKVGGRIAVRNGPADRAAVAHLRVADVTGGVGQQRDVLGEHRTGLDVHVAGQCADGDVVAGIADVRQVTDAADVDQHTWLGEAQLHQRQQAVPAGEELGVVTMFADETDGLFGRTGADVVEGGGNHVVAPLLAESLVAIWYWRDCCCLRLAVLSRRCADWPASAHR